uniref:Caveolin n=1 Tax=Strigamia maritima TaxID=126957 RepID=T1J0E9_STRMM
MAMISSGYNSDEIVNSPGATTEINLKKTNFTFGASSTVHPTDTSSFQSGTPEIEEMASNEPGFDMENRDPNNMNIHLQLLWDDIVAEPEGIRSLDCVWRSAFKVYKCSMDCCYGFLTILFSIPIAFCIGINFACLAFQHVWCVGPFFREWKLRCHVLRNFFRITLSSICGPCCETCGLIFSQIRIRQQKMEGLTDKIFDTAGYLKIGFSIFREKKNNEALIKSLVKRKLEYEFIHCRK